jgi:TPR repeat protein
MKLNKKYIAALLSAILLFAGFLFLRGILISKGKLALKEENSAVAIKYLRPLVAIGDPEAQGLYGTMYSFGIGVKKDDQEAYNWYIRAGATQAEAEFYIAENNRFLYERHKRAEDADEALKWYSQSAGDKNPKAAAFLGKAYSEGLLGLPRDEKQARYWSDLAKELKK